MIFSIDENKRSLWCYLQFLKYMMKEEAEFKDCFAYFCKVHLQIQVPQTASEASQVTHHRLRCHCQSATKRNGHTFHMNLYIYE